MRGAVWSKSGPAGHTRYWPLRTPAFSCKVDIRASIVTIVFALLTIGLTVFAMSVGETKTTFADVWAALTGGASPELTRTVLEWRMPRVIMAVFVGGAMSIAGGVFQSLTRNPLGSTDIIGFNAGAFAGVLIASIFVANSRLFGAIGALVGGFITATIIYFLSFTRKLQGLRLILIGIGISAIISSFNTYLISMLDVRVAQNISIWGVGSLSLSTWEDLYPYFFAIAGCIIATLLMIPRVRILEMGDDNASSLGVSPARTLMIMVIIAVVLTATTTVTVGPIGFIGLAAPHIAKFLIGTSAFTLLPALVVGSFLMASADLVARVVIAPSQLPAGVVTIIFGGAYLLYLSIRGKNDYRR